ncbi:nuclear transport factor 2 family protein [Sphingomonas koreensis]
MDTPPELAIRLQRARFNQALADADLAVIGPLLARDVVLVAGTDSALLSGRKAQLLAWKREFAASERTIYLRSPETVTLSPIGPVAFEQGAWQGTVANGDLLASGIYTAKWRRIDADWLIEAEVYLTLA